MFTMNHSCGEFSQQCEILGRASLRSICSGLKSSMCEAEHSKGGELQFHFTGSHMGLPTHKCKWAGTPFNSSPQSHRGR